MNEVMDKFRGFLADINLGNGIEITRDTKLIEIGVDSIALMTLLVFVEEEYDFTPDEDILLDANFQTVGEIVDYVSLKIEK